ncbi:DEK domain-containing chromatin-associated protein 1-like isoform X1 [Triticum urartu]|uniref:DEK-C domain-containing protein n=1 Tax=Triticum urartu TaxID=4572 RepID=A0A8R7TQ85_TRIUA|nr:DEK domain-containing chromatin-associated protein 1-like isoform X1 [Triticum urartu]
MDDEAQETPNVGDLPKKAPKVMNWTPPMSALMLKGLSEVAARGAKTEKGFNEVSVFREQILQLAGIACHEEEGKSRTELLEKLKTCNKVMLVELCRSFDVPGSTSTKKDELVTIVMEFLMEHCSGIIYTDPDKAQLLSCQKFKKRKRKKNGADLSGGEPSKKRKPDGTLLEFCSQEEADGRKAVEDRTNHSEFSLRDSRDELVNDSALGKLAVVPLPGVLFPTDEQTLITTPSAKLFSNVENDTMDMAASMKKNISVTKKKAIQNTDSKEKSGGKTMSRGDAKPWKQAPKPSKDELRQAVSCILGAANFATMTFGEVVKAVDKYFGKDLFERKPLVRALIEEELFRLAKEAERKEVEEEEAMEAKVKAAKDSARDGRVESDIDKEEYEVEAGPDGKSKDAEKIGNSKSSDKGGKSGICVKAGEKGNSNAAAAENLQDGKSEVDDTRKKEFSKDCEAEKIVQNANGDGGMEMLRDGEAETGNNCNGNTIGGSGEKDDTTDGRCEEGRAEKDAENAGDCEPEESETNEPEEEVKDVKSKEASGNEITLSHGAN